MPPPSSQTPSASRWLSTLAGGATAVRTASGTGIVATGAFGFTLVTRYS